MPLYTPTPLTIEDALDVIELQRHAINALARACDGVVISENRKVKAARDQGQKCSHTHHARQCRKALNWVITLSEAIASAESVDPRQGELFNNKDDGRG
jgi:hypothetical protein